MQKTNPAKNFGKKEKPKVEGDPYDITKPRPVKRLDDVKSLAEKTCPYSWRVKLSKAFRCEYCKDYFKKLTYWVTYLCIGCGAPTSSTKEASETQSIPLRRFPTEPSLNLEENKKPLTSYNTFPRQKKTLPPVPCHQGYAILEESSAASPRRIMQTVTVDVHNTDTVSRPQFKESSSQQISAEKRSIESRPGSSKHKRSPEKNRRSTESCRSDDRTRSSPQTFGSRSICSGSRRGSIVQDREFESYARTTLLQLGLPGASALCQEIKSRISSDVDFAELNYWNKSLKDLMDFYFVENEGYTAREGILASIKTCSSVIKQNMFRVQRVIAVGSGHIYETCDLTMDTYRICRLVTQCHFQHNIQTPLPPLITLFRPSVLQLLHTVAEAVNSLDETGILLLYISAEQGRESVILPGHYTTRGLLTKSKMDVRNNYHDIKAQTLHPNDLVPFMRRPIFLIVESNAAIEYENINPFTVPCMIIMAPAVKKTTVFGKLPEPGIMTMFLTKPIDALLVMADVPLSSITLTQNLCYILRNRMDAFIQQALKLHNETSIDDATAAFSGDLTLQLLLAHFLFCGVSLRMYKKWNRPIFWTSSSPKISESLYCQSTLQLILWDIITELGIERFFRSPIDNSSSSNNGEEP